LNNTHFLKKFPLANWNVTKNYKEFYNHIMKILAIKTIDDLYKLKPKYIEQYGGKALLEKVFENSLLKSLQSVYPNHNWLPWKLKQDVPDGFWDKSENQIQYMEWLSKELRFNTMEDWYKLTKKDIIENGGLTLLNKFGQSPSKLVESIYPNHKWKTFRRHIVPNGYWNNMENQKQFIDWLGKHLGFNLKEDWYNISSNDIKENGGGTLLRMYGHSPYKLIESIYPEHKWIQQKFVKDIWSTIKW
jgi:hypothetical protein